MLFTLVINKRVRYKKKAKIFRVLFGKAFEKHPLMSMTSDIQHLNSWNLTFHGGKKWGRQWLNTGSKENQNSNLRRGEHYISYDILQWRYSKSLKIRTSGNSRRNLSLIFTVYLINQTTRGNFSFQKSKPIVRWYI